MSVDPTQRERVRDDLREFVRGEVLFDELSRGLYATDASIFEVEPLGAVAPLDAADVQSIVRYCGQHKLPLIARGAGTGLAGEALGSGLVLDLSRHLRGICEIGADTVRVQPGVVLQQLNAELAKVGRRFAPDPASGASCTIGGMLANNASGSRCMKHGYTRYHVARLKVVLDSGDEVDVGVETMATTAEATSRLAEIVRATAALLRQHEATIRAVRPATPFNRCGYDLTGVLTDEGLNLPRLLVGSEGTLALFTEATLKTVPLAGGRGVALFGFGSLESALKAVRLATREGPAACELLDRRLISLARSSVPEGAPLLPSSVESALLVEFEADRPSEARRLVQAFVRQIHELERLSEVAHAAFEPAEIALFWRLRDSALPNLYGMGRGPSPVAFIEDIGVPPDNLGAFLTRVQEVLQRHELTASFLTHAATGQVHVRPFMDLGDPAQAARLWPLAEEVYALVLDMGGTVSAQHGTGLARTPWVPRQYGRLYPVFVSLKSIFDPHELFNPGKIVSGVLDRPEWPLRSAPRRPPADRLPLALTWRDGAMEQHVQACNGCGECRLETAPARMCPIFRVTHGEAATPRAKANLLRRVWQAGDPKRLSDDDVRAVADLCVNCKMCASECPAHVNVPKLMLEVKAAHHAEHGLDRADWFLSRIELFAAMGSRLSLLINPLLENRAWRWALERLFGISRLRRLPGFAPRSFLRLASRRRLTRRTAGPNRVAYFVDVFANYNDPQIAEAAVAVLRHNGLTVYVPPGQWSSGMASLAMGDVETARELAEANLRVLGELAREGYRIVCSEPTAALMLSHDYLDLIDDPVAKLVADQTIELMAFLGELHEAGRLKTDFQPLDVSVGQHVPCHLKALGRPIVTGQLLSLIPQMRVHTIDVSCSGMAGTYGLKRRNYGTSLEAGRPMLEELKRPRVLFGSAECSACRMQMEEGSGKRALHPVQYLALAYGLMPGIEQRLRKPLNGRNAP